MTTYSVGIVGRRYSVRRQPTDDGMSCFCCLEFRPRRARQSTPPPRVPLERFLVAHGITSTPLVHKLTHSYSQLGLAPRGLSEPRLLAIRRGERRPSWMEAKAIRLAIASILQTPVAITEIFDMREVGR